MAGDVGRSIHPMSAGAAMYPILAGLPDVSEAGSRIRAMARIFVEGWSPEYGAPLDPDEALAPAEGSVDTTVEVSEWEPIPGVDDGCTRIAFVDGVRRIDARLTLDDPAEGPVAGICGTFAVGATVWDRARVRSSVDRVRVERLAIIAGGRPERLPAVDLDPPYITTTTASHDPVAPIVELQTRMRRAEGETASDLADQDCFVLADGPLNDLRPGRVVGYVKSHRVSYLPPERNAVVAALAPAARTPLFTISDYKRYSWYVRLATLSGGHSWTGVVRCEASGQLPIADVRAIADRTAAVLPTVASEPHVDPRAPQNLVPIAALERELRHRMGDQRLVFRAVRAAVMREAA
jgi:hypothetical protein